MLEKLLQLKNISAAYGEMKVLDGINLEIDRGEIVALMGPNGAGKSTILKVIFGLVPHSSGEIIWQQHAIRPVTYEMVNRGISFVPQCRRVFNHLSVRDNLEMGGFVVANKNEIKERLAAVLEMFPELKKKIKDKAGTLSGGQQQMLALARGMMINPKVLLLDEPTLGLAPKIVKEVFEKIKEINQREKITVLVVEHNLKSLLEIANRAYVLDKGHIAAHGLTSDLVNSKILEAVFFGKTF
jgi:branched-chain amino acid transport system ATP-binding protein